MARKKGEGSVYYYNGRWYSQIQYTDLDGSTKVKRFSDKSKKCAEAKLKSYMETKVNPIKKIKESAYFESSGNKTFQEFSENVVLPIHRIQVTESSYFRLVATLNNMVYPQIGEFPLLALTPQVIQEYLINYLYTEGYWMKTKKGAEKRSYAHSSLKRAYSAASIVLNHAVKYEYIPHNPMQTVKIPSKKRWSDASQYKVRVMDEQTVSAFKKEALRKDKKGSFIYKYGTGFLFCLNTGLRIGELCALKIRDFDFSKHLIYVHTNVTEYYDEEKKKIIVKVNDYTKSDAGDRYVPLNDDAEQYAKERIHRYKLKKDDFLMCMSNHDMSAPSNLRRQFNRIALAAQLPEGISPHALRRTFASSCFKSGMDPEIIAKILGHSSTNVTMDFYIQISNEQVFTEFRKVPEIKGC